MRKALVGAITLALVGFFGSQAADAAIFDFTFTNTTMPSDAVVGGPFTVNAVIDATLVGGTYEIDGISGTVTQPSGMYNILSTLPPTTSGVSPAGYYFYDNSITQSGGTPNLSTTGILFFANTPDQYGLSASEFNIWWNGNGDSYTLSTTASNNVNAQYEGVGILTAVPKSSTWAMMILGFCGLGFMAYRRKCGTLRIA